MWVGGPAWDQISWASATSRVELAAATLEVKCCMRCLRGSRDACVGREGSSSSASLALPAAELARFNSWRGAVEARRTLMGAADKLKAAPAWGGPGEAETNPPAGTLLRATALSPMMEDECRSAAQSRLRRRESRRTLCLGSKDRHRTPHWQMLSADEQLEEPQGLTKAQSKHLGGGTGRH